MDFLLVIQGKKDGEKLAGGSVGVHMPIGIGGGAVQLFLAGCTRQHWLCLMRHQCVLKLFEQNLTEAKTYVH